MPIHFRKSDSSFQMNCHSAVTICTLLSFCKGNEEKIVKNVCLQFTCYAPLMALLSHLSAVQQDVKFEVL